MRTFHRGFYSLRLSRFYRSFSTMADPTSAAGSLPSSNPLQDHFRDVPLDKQAPNWSILWDSYHRNPSTPLPFDRGIPNPALAETLTKLPALMVTYLPSHSANSPPRKRALVPGCGRGYDVLQLAAFGYDAWGLEVSDVAVAEAWQEAAKKERVDMYPVRKEGGTAGFLLGNFFDVADWQGKNEAGGAWAGIGAGFDVIYDFTVCSRQSVVVAVDRAVNHAPDEAFSTMALSFPY